jgi:hypothetical protein
MDLWISFELWEGLEKIPLLWYPDMVRQVGKSSPPPKVTAIARDFNAPALYVSN